MKMRVTIDDQSFDVEVGDLKARPIPVMVDGETLMVMPEEQSQATSQTNGNGAALKAAPSIPAVPAAAAAAAAASASVIAPMPGVIISVAVKVVDCISVGQELCVLEAMKMKNSIRANRAGKIAAVRVAPGDQAVRGTVLLEYGD